ncbi:glycosyltransferase [Hyphomonas sp. GM-8P]|uniref:glycosyltransferase n=1 Tax=Hyphomonas sp. GM-8P TaxID=1280945 RepID=UPI000DBF60A4|nr:glycosyltransferase [Hyphomonas sp. GM-8P]RAN39212.1 hypothetical protein HY26_16680 [Hyphomonas sp. GM-8P]
MTGDFSPLKRIARRLREEMLPRPTSRTRNLPLDGPVVVAGMFRTASGLGEAAKLTVQGLRTLGLSPTLVDLSSAFRQVDQEPFDMLGELPRTHRGTLILAINAPETRAALQTLGLRRWHNWRIIGYWAWELNEAPPSWLPIAGHLTEIWTPSEFVTRTIASKVQIPVLTVPYPVRPHLKINPESLHRPAGTPLRVMAMADGRSSFFRKNVLAAARIYVRAFSPQNNSRLTIKLRNVAEFPDFQRELHYLIGDRNDIDIIEGTIPSEQKWDLIASHDIMLSTHRAEGYGLHLAEAMSLGLCAVATGWSGNTQFMNQKNSALLPYSLEDVIDPYDIYDPPIGSQWARIDEDAGAQVLRDLDIDRDRLTRLRQAATATDFVADSISAMEHALTGAN